jgi:hypothetical protein
MKSRIRIWATRTFAILIMAAPTAAQTPNKAVGTWRPISGHAGLGLSLANSQAWSAFAPADA